MKKLSKVITSMLMVSLLMLGGLAPAVTAETAVPAETALSAEDFVIDLTETEAALSDLGIEPVGDEMLSEILTKFENLKDSGDSAALESLRLVEDVPNIQATTSNVYSTEDATYLSQAMFSFTAGDLNVKNIAVTSAYPIRVRIFGLDDAISDFTYFDSNGPRIGCMIARHFVPGYEYLIVVDSTGAQDNISAFMTGANNGSWVTFNNDGATSVTQQNILFSNLQNESIPYDADDYQIGIGYSGTYNYTFTVVTGILGLTVEYKDVVTPSNNLTYYIGQDSATTQIAPGLYQYEFTKPMKNTGNVQTNYKISLANRSMSPGDYSNYYLFMERQ